MLAVAAAATAPRAAAGQGTSEPAGPPAVVRVGEVTAVAWPGQLDLALALAELAERPADWPGLGRVDPGPLRLIVVAGPAELARMTGGRAPGWGAGIAVPGARTIVLRADAGDPARTLRHELAHLALHRLVRVRVPLWFDEGYATWAAGEWDRLDALELNVAVLRGRVPELEALDGALRGDAPTAEAAYALAASAVLELARRHPDGSLAPLLGRLRQGAPFDSALVATTGLTPGQFAEAWRRSVKRRYGILTWLAAGGLWALLALAVLAAGWLRRRADRDRRAALDQGWVVEPEAGDPDELDPTKGPL